MIKCMICQHHQQHGKQHICKYVPNKIIFGNLYEPFLDYCEYLTYTEKEKQRRAYKKQIKKAPIDDRLVGIIK